VYTMSSRQFMRDAVTRHQMYLNRYSAGIQRQLVGFVNNLKGKVLNQLDGESITDWSKARLTSQLNAMQKLGDSLTADINSKVSTNMINLAKYEAGYTQRLIENASKVVETDIPNLQQLKAAVFTNILDKSIPTEAGLNVPGSTIQETLTDFGDSATGAAIDAVRTGYALGQTNDDITTAIESALTDQISRNFASTLARTITNYTASAAKLEFYQQNEDVIDGYEVVAVLDSETTLTCANLAGQVFDIEDFDPPPYHYNCRSTFIGVVQDKFKLNLEDPGRPAVDENGDAIDDISGSTNYSQFLDRQSPEFVKDFLGDKRAALYDAGMPLSSFVDEKYRPITLADLQTKDNEHFFEAAGLVKTDTPG
jgi:SPP1 gp7 family putative phage head morphogenesis protein